MSEMIDRTLICYGTRYGSTEEIAERIGEVLREKGASVDVVDLKKGKIKSLEDYVLVVVGSGIQANNWTKEPKKFLEKNRKELSRKRVATFVSCGSAYDPTKCDEATEHHLRQVAGKYPEIAFVAMGLFGPKYDSTRGNFLMRKIMKSMLAQLAEDPENPPEVIDYRDWEKIEKWAASLISEF
jgi:menaquinone-dependent protoporphyrinogen oxidase